MANKSPRKRIIISRTDAIGDVILTLPMCGIIKKHLPEAEIIFLGKAYTKSVIACCEHVDEFMDADELFKLTLKEAIALLKNIKADALIHVFPNKQIARLGKDAGIPIRVGTTNRLFHWGNINKLIRLSRKNSSLHESQLNCKLLKGIGIDVMPDLVEMAEYTGFTKMPSSKSSLLSLLDKGKINVIFHPKSNVSAREWSLDNFRNLINLLPSDKYSIFISGTDKEKVLLDSWIKSLPPHVIDITGKLTLEEFIAFIKQADCLVAASTGPLHIAAALGIHAVGIYPPIKPMHPGRWQPVGKKANYLCVSKSCSDCKSNPQECHCMNEVTPVQVFEKIKQPED